LRTPITQPSTTRSQRSTADAAPIRAPSFDELETLVTCAAEGSLASAAAILSISRPAVAKRVANLEALAGRPLLRRVGNGVRLTNAGAKLVAATPPIFHQREILLELLCEIRNEGEEANSVFCDFVGRARHDVLGIALEDAGMAFDGANRAEIAKRLGQDGAPANLSVFAKRPDGSAADGSATARMVAVADVALMAIVVDERA
jgi:hypothetical protein